MPRSRRATGHEPPSRPRHAAAPVNTNPVVVLAGDRTWLATLSRALRRHRPGLAVRTAASGHLALQLLRQLERAGDDVVALLAAARLADVPGETVLEAASAIFPGAALALLSPARAVQGQQDGAPVLLDAQLSADQLATSLLSMLDAGVENNEAPVRAADSGEGIRLIGDDAAATQQLRDLFARNSIPHRFLPAAKPEVPELLTEHGTTDLPVLLTGDGQILVQPTPLQVAVALGEPAAPQLTSYDLVIVGAGPAGLAAAVNAASEGICTLLVERTAPGGQAGTSSRIENYVGFPLGVTGAQLAARAFTQAVRLGAHTFGPVEVVTLQPEDDGYRVILSDHSSLRARAVILATGVAWNRLDADRAERFEGHGLFYGSALAAATAVQDRDVHVVGGANSAGQAAVFLADIARTVTVVLRGPALEAKMSSYLVRQLSALPNVTVRRNAAVSALHGEDRLTAVTLTDRRSGRAEVVASAAVFSFIGARPDTAWLPAGLDRDTHGYLLTNNGDTGRGTPLPYETSLPGVFAAGDVRAGSIKRVSSGVGEGAACMAAIHSFLAQVPADTSLQVPAQNL